MRSIALLLLAGCLASPVLAQNAHYELVFDASGGVGPGGNGSFDWDWTEWRMTNLTWDFGAAGAGGLSQAILDPFFGGDLLFGFFLATRDRPGNGFGALVEGGMGNFVGTFPGDDPDIQLRFCWGVFNSIGCGMPNSSDSTYNFSRADGSTIARGVVTSTPACTPAATSVSSAGLASVHSVQIDGRTYDVYFVDDEYTGALTDLAFDNETDARRASEALEAAIVDGVNGDLDSDPMLTAGCAAASACEILTPWSYDPVTDDVNADGLLNQPGLVDDFTTATLDADTDLSFDPARVWARWALTPPNDCDDDGITSDLDNCLLAANPGQLDSDEDNLGNACDADIAPDVNDCGVNFLDLNVMKDAFFSNPGSPNWNPDADLNGDGSVNFADLNTMKDGFFSAPGPTALKNFCEPCEYSGFGQPSFYRFTAQLSSPLSVPFLPTGEPDRYRVVFRTLRGPVFGFKVLNTANGFECDTPPSLLELGRQNDYACGIPDGSPIVPIEIPEPGCYAVDLVPQGPFDVRLFHRDFNEL